jgi:hypothetical protein
MTQIMQNGVLVNVRQTPSGSQTLEPKKPPVLFQLIGDPGFDRRLHLSTAIATRRPASVLTSNFFQSKYATNENFYPGLIADDTDYSLC